MDTQVHFGHQLKHLESQCMDDNARWLLNHNTSCKFQKDCQHTMAAQCVVGNLTMLVILHPATCWHNSHQEFSTW
ncbi:hypothetical protein DAI22_08g103450 [Oryza sativa Japonica Group]|nr:hypothetical protein DAI22_08g103450 [Oryza sativa Japonica Group]